MILRRTLPLLMIVFFLTGCFRQAEDTFDTVGSSQNSGEIGITQEPIIISESATPTIEVAIIDPNATEIDAESVAQVPSETPRTISPTNEAVATNTRAVIPTATEVIASITPEPTQPTFVTPDIVQEVELASATPQTNADTPTLEPSPTAFDTLVELGDCDYEIQDGENLFRIAIDNDVALANLLSVNNLTEASIIQPGQVLIIPNCDSTSSVDAIDEVEVDLIPTAIVLDDCDYAIQSGDTLFAVAVEYDVTLADLLAENELTENAVIQPEQIIRIPNCVDGDTEDTIVPAESTEEASGESEEIVHIVEAGDTLQSISLRYGIGVNAIVQANTIPDLNNLTAGQQLVIPDPNAEEEE